MVPPCRRIVRMEQCAWNWPDKNRYDTLKEKLIHCLSKSQSQWIQRLLKREEIGDRTLSQFLRHMPTLAGEAVPDEFLRTMWVNRLLPTTSAIVTAMAQPLDELTTITDQIQESSSPVSPHGERSAASETKRAEKLGRRAHEDVRPSFAAANSEAQIEEPTKATI